jgi:hypothetical protein
MRAAFSSIVVLMVISTFLQLSLVVDPWSLLSSSDKDKSPLVTGDTAEVAEMQPIKALAGTLGSGTWDCGPPELKRASFVASFCSHAGDDESSMSSSVGPSGCSNKVKNE